MKRKDGGAAGKVLRDCESLEARFRRLRKEQALAVRRLLQQEREQAYRDLGLVKVRGNLGGVYWE